MKTEIKTIVEDLITHTLNGIGDQIKGEVTETRDEIIMRNINISLLKINALLVNAKVNIAAKFKKGGGNLNSLLSALNEEL